MLTVSINFFYGVQFLSLPLNKNKIMKNIYLSKYLILFIIIKEQNYVKKFNANKSTTYSRACVFSPNVKHKHGSNKYQRHH